MKDDVCGFREAKLHMLVDRELAHGSTAAAL